MNAMIQGLAQQFLGPQIEAFAKKLGVNEATAKQAIAIGAPLIMAAIARYAAKPNGAASLSGALEKDQHSNLLGDILGVITNSNNSKAANGAGILGHLLGDQTSSVAQSLSSSLGVNAAQAAGLLETLAPLVMGAVGQQKQAAGLDAGGLASMLAQAAQPTPEAQADANPLGSLMQMLDGDKDGNPLNDLAGLAGKLFA